MSSDYAKGRIAGINEAVARLALRECNLPMGESLAECGKCLLAVSALLPPLPEPPADVRAEAEKIALVPTTAQIEDACSVDDDFEAEIQRWLYDTENHRGAGIVECLQDDLKVLRQAVVAFDMAVRLDAIEPPADAEVAQASALGMAFSEFQAEVAKSGALIRLEAIHQAERAVIEAAMIWAQMSLGEDKALSKACRELATARQRSAAAKEQPNAPKKPCGHEYVRCDKNRTSGVAWVCDLCGCDIPLKAAAKEPL